MSENEDQIDTADDQSATDDDADEEQVDDADNASEDDSDEQGSDTSERLYAGKFRTPEQLEGAYEEIQRFTGGRKILEEKAQAYDRLVKEQADAAGQSVKGRPKLTTYVSKTDGTIDTEKFDADMDEWELQQKRLTTSATTQETQRQLDMRWAENQFPYLLTSKHDATAVMAGYYNGDYASVRDSARAHDEYRKSLANGGKKDGADAAKRELSRKVRGNTERSTGRTGETDGEMTTTKFATLSREEQAEYLGKRYKNPQFKS